MSTSTLFFRIAVIAHILVGLSVSDLRAQNPSFVESTPSVFNFTAGGSGAQARNVAFKLDEFRSVKDYGATGDGSTDDTQAIRLAIATGASLYFPPGTYNISGPLRPKDNQKLLGAGWNSILSLQHDDSSGVMADGRTNIGIHQLKIDGNGKKLTEGIRLTNCRYSVISDVWITNMGTVNPSSPTNDNTTGGVGILLVSIGGECAWITVERCRIDHIAAGGNYKGDGIEVADYDANSATVHDVVVRNCRVSTVGRHCYTAGGNMAQKPYNILFENCYGEKSALDWLDVEDAQSVRVVNGVAKRCGNDQTYFNPASAYGANYGLLAAIAVGNASGKVEVSGFSADSCYLGWTAGGSTSVELDHVTITNSTRADYALTLANHPTTITIRNSAFLTPGKTEVFYYDGSGSTTPKLFSNVVFASPVRMSTSANVRFDLCRFGAGIIFQATGIKNMELNGCLFTDFPGAGVSWSGYNKKTDNLVIQNCRFLGAGQMTHGVQAIWESLYHSKISDNVFSGLTTAGIGHANMAGDSLVFDLLRNRFSNMPTGIELSQATKYMRISGNTFEKISLWAILQGTISSPTSNVDNQIIENIAGDGVANGIKIENLTGISDYLMILGNNMRKVTGIKYNINANVNGINTNNL